MAVADQVVLVTGATGSFGRALVEILLTRHRPRQVVVFSRDEHKQREMAARFDEARGRCLRYHLGDVRDPDALRRALDGVDVVVHAAALKHVPAAERHPLEAVKTNVLGAAHLITAALERGVQRVLAVGTDKAAHPASMYGATKLCADKLFVAADREAARTRFATVRFGNMLGSRGSVVPFFRTCRRHGRPLPITDPRMTRFCLTPRRAAELALEYLAHMEGGEIFVPRIPSMKIVDLARAIAPESPHEIVGRRPGEKLHEVMVPEEEAPRTVELQSGYAILAEAGGRTQRSRPGERPCPEGFRYASDTNSEWLGAPELAGLLETVEIDRD
jgi:UDP-N-acetylglucosamine 4,6-dehydratase